MEFEANGAVSDHSSTEFGIREITSDFNSVGGRAFHINGKNILIRGGGWTPDLMLRETSQRLHDEFRYVRDMGLNTIRLEGKLETQEFFDLADRQGILVMAGWCCCDFWERWPRWQPQDFEIAKQSLRDQIYRLRSHPSLVMWLNGSDNPPPPDVEQMYLDVEKELFWPNPVVSSATGKKTSVTGDSGVKMTGPYEYVAPSYWEVDTPQGQPDRKQCNPGGCGGAYGFNTETSMGPAVPPVESIRAMVGKDHMWPIDDVWNYHAGGGEFKTIGVFSEALANRYGKSDNVEDFATKSQLQTYEGVRAMYEAYSRNKYQATGVIQWMLNNAWPSMIWHLYDYYLRPGGGYFGAKRAMEALHPIYGYDDHSIWVVSSQYEDAKGLKLTTKIYNLDMTEKFTQSNPGRRPRRQHREDFHLARRRRPEPHILPRFAAGRFHRQTRRLEFLLALDQARNPRLGQDHLVDDADCVLRRLHRALTIAEGETESHRPQRAQRRRRSHARDSPEPEQESGILRAPESRQRREGRRDSPRSLGRQLHFPDARREARSDGDLPRQRVGRGEAGGRSQRLERGIDRWSNDPGKGLCGDSRLSLP